LGGVLAEKLIVAQLIEKFPTFHETWRFITLFTRFCHGYLSWVRPIHSTSAYPIYFKIHFPFGNGPFP